MLSLDARLLKSLRQAEFYCSLDELAVATESTPSLIETHIAGLRSAGYEIELRPHAGYRLVASPDRLIADDISSRLEGVELIREIVVFEQTNSTNDVVVQMGRQGVKSGIVAFAEHQTAGRGRLGRRWESASHQGLWFSLLLRPSLNMENWSRLTTWAAVGVARGIEQILPSNVQIKWPNDIYINGKKIAGILTESCAEQGGNGFAVVGIGINANQTVFPHDLINKATSARMIFGDKIDRMEMAASILKNLDAVYGKLVANFEAIVAEARQRSFLPGKRVKIQCGQVMLEGVAEDLDQDGGLIIREKNGKKRVVTGGEITFSEIEN